MHTKLTTQCGEQREVCRASVFESLLVLLAYRIPATQDGPSIREPIFGIIAQGAAIQKAPFTGSPVLFVHEQDKALSGEINLQHPARQGLHRNDLIVADVHSDTIKLESCFRVRHTGDGARTPKDVYRNDGVVPFVRLPVRIIEIVRTRTKANAHAHHEQPRRSYTQRARHTHQQRPPEEPPTASVDTDHNDP